MFLVNEEDYMNTVWLTKTGRYVFRNWILSESQLVAFMNRWPDIEIQKDKRGGIRPEYRISMTDNLLTFWNKA